MNITIIGGGVVGEATGKGLLKCGHTVYFNDVNQKVLDKLNKEGLNASKEVKDADIYFICTHERNVSMVVGRLHEKTGLIVVRSTTQPGTVLNLMNQWKRHICHNPEFLRERWSLKDFLYPRRIVIGECCEKHGDILEELYNSFKVPIIRTTPTNSELAKLSCNAYLSCVISFWNEIDSVVRAYDGDTRIVRGIAVLDRRIPDYGAKFSGKFGGMCLPKDLRSLIASAKKKGLMAQLIQAIEDVNDMEGG